MTCKCCLDTWSKDGERTFKLRHPDLTFGMEQRMIAVSVHVPSSDDESAQDYLDRLLTICRVARV